MISANKIHTKLSAVHVGCHLSQLLPLGVTTINHLPPSHPNFIVIVYWIICLVCLITFYYILSVLGASKLFSCFMIIYWEEKKSKYWLWSASAERWMVLWKAWQQKTCQIRHLSQIAFSHPPPLLTFFLCFTVVWFAAQWVEVLRQEWKDGVGWRDRGCVGYCCTSLGS